MAARKRWWGYAKAMARAYPGRVGKEPGTEFRIGGYWQLGTQELARELSLIAMWDREQVRKAQKGPGLEAFMEKWLRESTVEAAMKASDLT